jgi:hypothetical protein
MVYLALPWALQKEADVLHIRSEGGPWQKALAVQ